MDPAFFRSLTFKFSVRMLLVKISRKRCSFRYESIDYPTEDEAYPGTEIGISFSLLILHFPACYGRSAHNNARQKESYRRNRFGHPRLRPLP